jgi:predicted NBD/HSP70 family sugar kinase
MNILVIDIGGSHIKAALGGTNQRVRFDSTREMTPQQAMDRVREKTTGWGYDAVSIGYPGRVAADGPVAEPPNLGNGWISFNFEAALQKPVRLVNDAVLQALGAYDGGRMLFLGLGTGLGSALVTEHVVVPLELGELPYQDGGRLVDHLGRKGLERVGHEPWQQKLVEVVGGLRRAFLVDYVVLGGGNAERVDQLPPDTRCGGNEDAIEGGVRIWREMVEPHDRQPSAFWRIVR